MRKTLGLMTVLALCVCTAWAAEHVSTFDVTQADFSLIGFSAAGTPPTPTSGLDYLDVTNLNGTYNLDIPPAGSSWHVWIAGSMDFDFDQSGGPPDASATFNDYLGQYVSTGPKTSWGPGQVPLPELVFEQPPYYLELHDLLLGFDVDLDGTYPSGSYGAGAYAIFVLSNDTGGNLYDLNVILTMLDNTSGGADGVIDGWLQSDFSVICRSEYPRLSLEADVCTTTAGGDVVVEIVMTDVADEISGGQFFLSYDPSLTFVSADPGDPPPGTDPLNPFEREVYEFVDTGARTIDYAVGLPFPNPPSGYQSTDPVVLAKITFSAASEECDVAELVTFRDPGFPFQTRLSKMNPTGPLVVPTVDLHAITLDWTDPTIIGCPSDITQSNDTGNCSAVVTWTAPTANDNCPGVTLTPSHNPGDTFPVGVTTVTYTAEDACGNTNATPCSFTVTVNDTENPVISGCPSDITQSNDAGVCEAVVTW
ncbi:MAG: HYR domain-containing protein, partial [Phycisphaerae bacterium]|nr:HYR domain-containing protein [Phycisphaerae bacterium]